MEPFLTEIQNGNHPVGMVFIDLENDGRRVGLSRLKLTEQKATKWQLAVTENDDTSDLEDDSYIGYPVDAGLGCFIVAEFARTFDEIMDTHYKTNGSEFNYYDDVLASEFKLNAFA